ncbi:MAG: hypothetical protein E6I31_13530 [Chloroflexi bacterium]|nr:MAG: hypothetical protein E6I31_13530 [Chloroflexota bacterium]
MAQRAESRPAAGEEADYRTQLARYPRLSNDEERRLLNTQGPARDAANRRLIEHNLYLVLEAAQARKKRGVAFGDLFQEGTFVVACRLLESAQRLLSGRLGRPATPAELAKLLQWEEARVNVILGMLGEARDLNDQELLDYIDDLDDHEA